MLATPLSCFITDEKRDLSILFAAPRADSARTVGVPSVAGRGCRRARTLAAARRGAARLRGTDLLEQFVARVSLYDRRRVFRAIVSRFHLFAILFAHLPLSLIAS